MTEAETILKLIEEVDIDDDYALSEIDSRTWCYVYKNKLEDFGEIYAWVANKSEREEAQENSSQRTISLSYCRYSTSRDALMGIRPKEWDFINILQNADNQSLCQLRISKKDFHSPGTGIEEVFLKTPELAELHAIIQAIEYGRTHE